MEEKCNVLDSDTFIFKVGGRDNNKLSCIIKFFGPTRKDRLPCRGCTRGRTSWNLRPCTASTVVHSLEYTIHVLFMKKDKVINHLNYWILLELVDTYIFSYI
jgi:hypothetical protein